MFIFYSTGMSSTSSTGSTIDGFEEYYTSDESEVEMENDGDVFYTAADTHNYETCDDEEKKSSSTEDTEGSTENNNEEDPTLPPTIEHSRDDSEGDKDKPVDQENTINLVKTVQSPYDSSEVQISQVAFSYCGPRDRDNIF